MAPLPSKRESVAITTSPFSFKGMNKRWLRVPSLLYKGEVPSHSFREKGEVCMATLSSLEGSRCHPFPLERREKLLWPPFLLLTEEVTSPPLKEKGEVAMATLSLLEGRGAIPFL